MALLSEEAEMEVRVEETHALDTNKLKLVEDFICALCANFPLDLVMCDKCENVFCMEEQTEYFSRLGNEACCMCGNKP